VADGEKIHPPVDIGALRSSNLNYIGISIRCKHKQTH